MFKLVENYSALLQIAARFCLSAVFLVSGVSKLLDPAGSIAEVTALGLPSPALLYAFTVLIQIVGGLMVLVGFWARLGAFALLGFTVMATLAAHWHQPIVTLEHLAIVGGFLLIAVHGAGSLSLDHRRPA